MQTATLDDVFREHGRNVNAAHRNVGLVIETRPTPSIASRSPLCARSAAPKSKWACKASTSMCSKRTGAIPRPNKSRRHSRSAAFSASNRTLISWRTCLGATPDGDVSDFRTLVSDKRFLPDEVKMYPCALIDGTGLMAHYADGTWRPYNERELVGVLADNVLATPPYTRISRMIRDFSSGDIVDGNKKVNLREVVEAQADRLAAQNDTPIQEIRHRELAGAQTEIGELSLIDFEYETSNTNEHFLQWVTPENRIAGFLRLSLPCQHEVEKLQETEGAFPIEVGQAMIREVHVYGKVAQLHGEGQNAQHRGLGKALVERACEIALDAGYRSINVISAIGTRGYYARLGLNLRVFTKKGLWANNVSTLRASSRRGHARQLPAKPRTPLRNPRGL